MPNHFITNKEFGVELKKAADAFNRKRNSTIHSGPRIKRVAAKPVKVKRAKRWLIVKRDGREILNNKTGKGRAEYNWRVSVMVERQNGICSLGNHRIDHPTFEHENLRGMGGSLRDDRIEVDGKWQNSAACWMCNGQKGSKRI